MALRTTILLLFMSCIIFAQAQSTDYSQKINALLHKEGQKPFNGIIVVAQEGKIQYSSVNGYADLKQKTPLKLRDQFVIGSISKQVTAVLALQAMEKGLIALDVPIKKYLPSLKQSWADTVTIHHLLTHMDGIQDLDRPLLFPAGSQFRYNQINFDLLAQILEQRSGRSFMALSQDLFKSCGMKSTCHPDTKAFKRLVTGHTAQSDGKFRAETESYNKIYVAAGGFISTAADLVRWNEALHGGKLLTSASYQLLSSPQKGAIRQHPIFGPTEYGYGTTISNKDVLLQIGQTGFVAGYASMNFYFPKRKMSVIVLQNTVTDPEDLMKTFFYHLEVLDIVRK